MKLKPGTHKQEPSEQREKSEDLEREPERFTDEDLSSSYSEEFPLIQAHNPYSSGKNQDFSEEKQSSLNLRAEKVLHDVEATITARCPEHH